MTEQRSEKSRQVFEAIGRLHRSFQLGYGPLMVKHRWGSATFRTLLELASQETGASVKELAEAANITSGAMSQVIEQLHKHDLIERLEDASDRRIVRIRLTKKAKDRLLDFKKSQANRLIKVFEDLSDEEIEKLSELVSRLKLEEKGDWTGWGHWRGKREAK
ncbi:MAG TPA: MarR family transcriptional regulator [Candidatus Nanoarchaeia archaeon]|nr:MarR family transcriptional regulator [Candidatus Nanoarchaeia archaeon]